MMGGIMQYCNLSICAMRIAQNWCILGLWLLQKSNKKPHAGSRNHWTGQKVAEMAIKLSPRMPQIHLLGDQYAPIELPSMDGIFFSHKIPRYHNTASGPAHRQTDSLNETVKMTK